jgi:hypothetical protein
LITVNFIRCLVQTSDNTVFASPTKVQRDRVVLIAGPTHGCAGGGWRGSSSTITISTGLIAPATFSEPLGIEAAPRGRPRAIAPEGGTSHPGSYFFKNLRSLEVATPNSVAKGFCRIKITERDVVLAAEIRVAYLKYVSLPALKPVWPAEINLQ